MDNTNNQSIDTRKRADLYAAFESVDNILLKKYIKNLVSAPVCILPEEIANIVPGDNICVYHVDKIAYDKDENTLDKLTSVYSSVAAGGTDSVALILTSDGQKTDIYLGIVARASLSADVSRRKPAIWLDGDLLTSCPEISRELSSRRSVAPEMMTRNRHFRR